MTFGCEMFLIPQLYQLKIKVVEANCQSEEGGESARVVRDRRERETHSEETPVCVDEKTSADNQYFEPELRRVARRTNKGAGLAIFPIEREKDKKSAGVPTRSSPSSADSQREGGRDALW